MSSAGGRVVEVVKSVWPSLLRIRHRLMKDLKVIRKGRLRCGKKADAGKSVHIPKSEMTVALCWESRCGEKRVE